jgi:hypothetical protein
MSRARGASSPLGVSPSPSLTTLLAAGQRGQGDACRSSGRLEAFEFRVFSVAERLIMTFEKVVKLAMKDAIKLT